MPASRPRPPPQRALPPDDRGPAVRAWLGARGLPAEAYASWRRSLSERTPVPVRILAWARGEDGFVVGSPALLSVGGALVSVDGSGDAVPSGAGEWRHVGWHEIEHGGWNAESRSLSWTLYGGRRGRVALAEAGRLPELFRERVAASIAVERFVPLRGERGVTVTARRELGASGAITWHSSLTRGLSWSTDGVAEDAARASAALQSEYGSAPSGW